MRFPTSLARRFLTDRSARPARVLLLVVSVLALCVAPARAVSVRPDEMGDMHRWVSMKFADGDMAALRELPFTFRHGGRPSTELLPAWHPTRRSRPLDAARTEHTLTFTDPASGLEVRCVAIEYSDFPVVEWTVYFRNTGKADTPILDQVQALDATWQRGGAGEFLLHHAVGSPANKSDYAPRESPLPAGASLRFGGAGGRPTNTDWSYYNLEGDGRGMIVVVGWPGQWAGTFTRDAGRAVVVSAGQEQVKTKLLPGEEIRSPLIVLQFGTGDSNRAQNLWRRWMKAHGMPHPGGKLPPPQFVASSSRALRLS